MAFETDYAPYDYAPGAAMSAEAIPFPFIDAEHLVVTHIADATGAETVLVPGIDYVIAGDGAAQAGTITATAEWPGADLFRVKRRTPAVQKAVLPPGQPIPSKAVEGQLDRMAMHAQEQAADIARAPLVAEGETAPPIELSATPDGRVLAVLTEGGARKIKDIANDPAGAAQSAEDAAAAALLAGQLADEAQAGQSILSRQLAAKLFALAETPKAGVAIRRLRTDRLEIAVYTFIDAAGTRMQRWFITNRLNPANGGAPVLWMSTEARLYASTAILPPAENYSTGTYANAPVATQGTAGATARTGSWVSVTISGVPDLVRQATPGAGSTVTYTYSLAAGETKRFELRGAHVPGNGGKAKVTVKRDGVEINPDEYLLPLVGSERIASYFDGLNWGNVLAQIPVWRLTNSTGSAQSITVELGESVLNAGANNRIYDGGWKVYDDVAFDDTGLHGMAKQNTTLGGVTSLELPQPGARIVIPYTNVTRINIDYVKVNSGGQASFRLYDADEVEITDLLNDSVDTYSETTTTSRVTVAEELTKANYFLHVEPKNTKNAASSAYRLYLIRSLAQDETTAGVLGVDEIDDMDVAAQPGNFLDMSQNCLIGPNNVEAAFELRPASYVYGTDQVFVTATHRNDTTPTGYTWQLDGEDATAAFNATAALGWLYGASDAQVAFTSNVDTGIGENGLGTPGTVLGTMSYVYSFDRYGYHPDLEFLHTVDGKMRINYGLMLQCPGSDSDDVKILNRGAGGGFEVLAFDRGDNYQLADYAGSAFIEKYPSDAMAFVNAKFAVLGTLNNYPELRKKFLALGVDTADRFVYARSTAYNKGYLLLIGTDSSGPGFIVPAGTKWRMRKTYRAFPGDYRRVLGVSA